MSAAKLYPKTYKGKEDSSGYLARNDHPTSRSSPGWRGRVWVSEPGWHWLSGWLVHPREQEKPMLNVKLRGLTDQEAEKYCAPRGSRGGPPPSTDRQSMKEPEQYGDEDIPF
jgi:hypothetical protein